MGTVDETTRGRTRREVLTCAGLALVAFLVSVAVHRFVLQGFPNSADEYAYLWQARALASGHLTARTPEPRDAFAFFHLGDEDGIRYSRFPPGFPLLLVPGVWAGVPGLVNPLIAALALGGICALGHRWVGHRAALGGSLLTLLSPFFLLNAGSYHSHPAALLALVAATLALDHAARSNAATPLAAAGAALGLAFCVRPYTAVLLGAPVVMWLLPATSDRNPASLAGALTGWTHRKTWARLAWILAGILPFALLFGAVNQTITGSFWIPATRHLDPTEGVGFGIHGHTLGRGLRHTLFWCLEAVGYTFFMSPVLLFFARRRAGPRESLLWMLLVAPVVGYLFYWNPGGNRYGPRFYFEALLPFTLLTGVGLKEVLQRRAWRVPLVAAGMIGLSASGKMLLRHHEQVQARTTVFRMVQEQHLEDAVVILLSSSGDMHVLDLTRNPPDFEHAPVLFARGLGARDTELAQRYPERNFYYFRWRDGKGRLWPADLTHPESPDPLPDQ